MQCDRWMLVLENSLPSKCWMLVEAPCSRLFSELIEVCECLQGFMFAKFEPEFESTWNKLRPNLKSWILIPPGEWKVNIGNENKLRQSMLQSRACSFSRVNERNGRKLQNKICRYICQKLPLIFQIDCFFIYHLYPIRWRTIISNVSKSEMPMPL
jgi:hypothetical protein